MKLVQNPRPAAVFPRWSFATIDVEYDADARAIWTSFKADGDPCFTFQTLTDLADFRQSLRDLFASPAIAAFPVDYVAMASHKPGIFNLGGDLAMFARSIRAQERETLRAYAHACVAGMHDMAVGYGVPVVTLGVVAGQALGGGLECALAQDYLFAEEDAMLGVPEVAFNTFPGMGAVTLLTRRVGAAMAERVIVSGDTYSGRQMFDMGVVDGCAPSGGARAVARAWMIDGGAEKTARRLATTTIRRRCFPVSLDELIKIVDVWTDCSCDVTPRDLRHMERLVAAQRRITGADAA